MNHDCLVPYENTELADKVLFEFDDVVKSVGVTYFLLFGTVLGFYRDKSYIPHDHDIDVGIRCNFEKGQKLLDELEKKGFRLQERSILYWVFKNNIQIDIWHMPGHAYNPYTDNLGVLIYKGREFNIPSPIELYLQAMYGDWKTPREGKANAGVVREWARGYQRKW